MGQNFSCYYLLQVITKHLLWIIVSYCVWKCFVSTLPFLLMLNNIKCINIHYKTSVGIYWIQKGFTKISVDACYTKVLPGVSRRYSYLNLILFPDCFNCFFLLYQAIAVTPVYTGFREKLMKENITNT